MRHSPIAASAAALLALAGCGEKAKPAAETEVFDAAAEPSAPASGERVFTATADSTTGKVQLNIPGVDIKVDLPRQVLDGSKFDIDGVKLYPGSKITAMGVVATREEGRSNGKVDVAFTAPADPAKVRTWFVDKFGDRLAGSTGNTLTGRTRDDKPFRIELSPSADGTAGKIVVDG